MKIKQISNLRKLFSLVEDRHKKRDFLIKLRYGSIQNLKKIKLSNSYEVTFFFYIKIHLLYISFPCSIYMSSLQDSSNSKTLRK